VEDWLRVSVLGFNFSVYLSSNRVGVSFFIEILG
jgi:hypothetical protein